jgi:hypothetical protein
MRACTIGPVFLAAFALSGAARAVTYPAATLLGGEVAQAVLSNQCYIVRGASQFQRNGAANTAFVSVSEMVAGGYELNGRISLAFATTTSGNAHLPYSSAYPANVQIAPFSGYSQTYNPTNKGFTAQFTINFPGCSLPVHVTYNSP